MLGLLLLTSLTMTATAGPAKSTEVYASPHGSDAGSGTLARPFASIARARDEVRRRRADNSVRTTATITLRSGTYYQPDNLSFTAEDSDLTVRAHHGESVTISGGRPITGWRSVEANGRTVWATTLPAVRGGKWYFRSLYGPSGTLPRARLPKKGYYRVANPPPENTPLNVTSDSFRFEPGEISAGWRNLTDIEAVVLSFWEQSRMPLARVDESTSTAYLAKKSFSRLTDDFTPAGARYYVENVFEALSEPGEWYLDRQTGTLYYMPKQGEQMATTTLIAPVLERLVWVQGEAEHPVRRLRLEGITFAHTDWSLPSDRSGWEQASWGVGGAICIAAAEDCAIAECTISHVGGYGIQLAPSSSGTVIARNTMTDLGAGAVKMERGSSRTTVTDCEISDGGKVFHSAVGVLVMDSGYNRVAHNNIHGFDYSGVSAGWCWGYDRNNAVANVIEYNRIYDIGRGVLSDLAGVYTLGPQRGTVIRNNAIHDCVSNTYGGWGIYLDAASSYIRVENNVVYANKSGAFFLPRGRENILRNNIFALNHETEIMRETAEPHLSLTFERNIVYWNDGLLLDKNWDGDGFRFDRNLYWKIGGGDFLFGEDTLDQWRARGQDIHSLIADPLFRAPEKGDFSLSKDSPAAKIGFKPIDVSKVGPRS